MQASGLKPKVFENEYFTDRGGGDLAGMPIYMDCGATPSDCAILCRNRPDCVAYTFNICQDPRRCWLKHSAQTPTDNNCGVSFFFLKMALLLMHNYTYTY